MTTAKTTDKPSTKHHVVDHRFAVILSEDFCIETRVILDALVGEPKKVAIAILTWAGKTDNPAFALRCWARRHGRGAYGTPSVARGGISGTARGRGRGSGPARTGGITPRRSWGYGVGKETVLTGLARMAD